MKTKTYVLAKKITKIFQILLGLMGAFRICVVSICKRWTCEESSQHYLTRSFLNQLRVYADKHCCMFHYVSQSKYTSPFQHCKLYFADSDRRFLCCSYSLCVGGFVCGICFVKVCSSSLFLLLPQESCAL